MIKLNDVIARWSAAMHDDTILDALSAHEARQTMRDMLADLDTLVRLALVVREFGKARIDLAEKFEAYTKAWDLDASEPPSERAKALNEARRTKETALDRLEAIAVQLAGGNVGEVCGSEEVDDG